MYGQLEHLRGAYGSPEHGDDTYPHVSAALTVLPASTSSASNSDALDDVSTTAVKDASSPLPSWGPASGPSGLTMKSGTHTPTRGAATAAAAVSGSGSGRSNPVKGGGSGPQRRRSVNSEAQAPARTGRPGAAEGGLGSGLVHSPVLTSPPVD